MESLLPEKDKGEMEFKSPLGLTIDNQMETVAIHSIIQILSKSLKFLSYNPIPAYVKLT